MKNPVDVPAYGAPPTEPDPNNRHTFNALRAAMNVWMLGINSPTGSNMVGLAQSAASNAKSAQESRIATEAAAAGINIPMWVSGGTYSVGSIYKSPAAIAAGVSPLYICKVAISGSTVDPYLNSTNWSVYSIFGATGGATYTTSTTLTNASPFAISIAGGAGTWLKLPDATTLQAGAKYHICNAGENDVRVLDSAGAVLGFISPRESVNISLADSATAAGKWVHGLLEFGVTQEWRALSTTTGVNNIKAAVRIDSDRVMFIVGGQSGSQLHAVVWSDAAGGIGATYTVRASAYYANAVLHGTGQVMVISSDNGTAMQGIVLTATGTTITAGPVSSVTLSASCTGIGQLIATPTGFVLAFSLGTSGYIRGVSVASGSPAFGAEIIIGYPISVMRLYLSGSVVRVIVYSASSINFRPYTSSGATLTAGTPATVSGNFSVFKDFALGNGNIVVYVFNASTAKSVVYFVKLSGTTESTYQYSSSRTYSTPLNADYFEMKPVGQNKVAAFFNAVNSSAPNNREFVGVLLTDNNGSVSASSEYILELPPTGVSISIMGNNTSTIATVYLGTFILVFNCTSSLQLLRTVFMNTSMPSPSTGGFTRGASGTANPSVCANGSGTYFFSPAYPVVRKYTSTGDVLFIRGNQSIVMLPSVRGEDDLSCYIVSTSNIGYGIFVTRIEVCSN